MNPQDLINQNIRLLIGDLQVNLMVANARIQELEAQLAAARVEAPLPGEDKPNGKWKDALPI